MSDLEIPPETTGEFFTRIGLYLGALFQFTCILAIIIFPEKAVVPREQNGKATTEFSDQENWDSHSPNSNKQPSHRLRKQDKKKRR